MPAKPGNTRPGRRPSDGDPPRCDCGCGTVLQRNAAAGRKPRWVSEAHRKRAARAAARRKRDAAAASEVRNRYGLVVPKGAAPGVAGTLHALVEELRRAGATDAELAAVLACPEGELPPPLSREEDPGVRLLRAHPEDVAASVLRRCQLAIRLYLEMAATESGSVRAAALRGFLDADQRAVDVLRGLGRLPQDWSTLGAAADVRAAARDLMDVVRGLEDGTATPGDARAVLRRYAGEEETPGQEAA